MSERYSIWALPEESTEQELQKIIVSLSQLYGGPLFEPHLTLLADIKAKQQDLADVIDELAANLENFNLFLGQVSSSPTFFQSVFVHVLTTNQLKQQRLKARRMLQLEKSLFIPHVSLLYGHHDRKTRHQAMQQVIIPHKAYTITKFTVVLSGPDPQEWVTLHTAEIGKKKSDPF